MMDARDRQVAEQLERAVDIFERLACDVCLLKKDFRAVADRLDALDASVDALVLMAKPSEAQ